ncbi:hypothetical protein ELH27_01135 [Rhizobium leguminosarum]|uniref:hypothetical protein n=1 Tax=Rhizobium leguminosarum TaxID=384 RepID=UPI0010308CCE|nr:hypothetical protein [Rhizobium leguminosarum]TBC71553.1 hypothetical protein ELH27_01135 [Rhizobium leguminosarum]
MTDAAAKRESVSWTNLRPKEVNDDQEQYDRLGDEAEPAPVVTKSSDGPKIMYELAVIQQSLFSLEEDYHVSLAKQLALAADVATSLKQNFFQWTEFIAADWKGCRKPKLTDQADALRHVFRWLCGSTPAGQKRASFYYRAVGALAKKGLSGPELEKKLRKKGLKVLAARHAATSRSEPTETAFVSPFAPKAKGDRWRVRLDVEFDRKPDDLFSLSGEPVFTLRGTVKNLDAKRACLSVLGYSFVLDD